MLFAERKSDKCRLYNFSRIKKTRKWLKVTLLLVAVWSDSFVYLSAFYWLIFIQGGPEKMHKLHYTMLMPLFKRRIKQISPKCSWSSRE